MRRRTSFRDEHPPQHPHPSPGPGGNRHHQPPPPPPPPSNLLILAGIGPPPPPRPDISGKKAQKPPQYIFCFKAKETPAGKFQLS